MRRFRAPAGITSVSFGGESVNVAEDNTIEVEDAHAAAALTIGCVPLEEAPSEPGD